MNASFSQQVDDQKARWLSDTSLDAAWDARRLVDQLSKAGHHDDAIIHGDAALMHWADFAPLASAMAWALYRRDLQEVSEESNLVQRRRAKQALDRIELLSSSDPYGTFSPWTKSVLKLASAMVKRWPKVTVELISKLDKAQLSGEAEGDFGAERERWYLQFTKALQGAGMWGELLEACDAATEDGCIEGKNERWIRLRKAEALWHLGQGAAAEPILRREAARHGEWWLHARLARLLTELDQTADALHSAYRALRSGGAAPLGWETLALVGALLEDTNPLLAAEHIRLAVTFRKAKGWKANKELEARAERLGATAIDGSAATSELIRRLMPTWQEADEAERETGVVMKHLNEGAGFIAPDVGGGSLFFSRSKDSTTPLPSVGQRVSYIRRKSFDAKKARDSERAADWRIQ